MLGGAFMRKGATGQTPDMEVFPSIKFTMVTFVGAIILCTTEDPIGPTVEWRLKLDQGPKQVSLHWGLV